ncbi:MAG: hypothetical protein ABSE22_02795 [Xanthobacteraceae bacterium]|jgi:hypothetical protein
MWRKTTLKGRRVLPILLAGGIGYLLGGWHIAVLRSTELSAAETVALRYPESFDIPSTSSGAGAAWGGTMGDAQFALLNPEPMVPETSLPPPNLPQADMRATPQAATQAAAVEAVGTSPAHTASLRVQPSPRPVTAPPANEIKAVARAARRRVIVNRPGYMLNDAQIASIKERLNLTPDQEQMWPAVEAALRNIAYTRVQQARGQGAPAGATDTAAADPNAVQDLKSAAVPLIMSFDAEQKEEVRSIVHVMGLDQLASQF